MGPQKSLAGVKDSKSTHAPAAALARTMPFPAREHCPPVTEALAGRVDVTQALMQAQRNYGNRAVQRMLANQPATYRTGCGGNCATCAVVLDEKKRRAGQAFAPRTTPALTAGDLAGPAKAATEV